MNIQRPLFIFFFVLYLQTLSTAQFGLGLTFNYDFYQRYTNPKDNFEAGRSAGSVLTNISLGPKIWIGKPSFSFSVESQIGIAPLGLDTKEFKGLGMATLPIIGQLNFKGNSGLQTEQSIGYSIGGGIQYNRTELFGLKNKYEDLGVNRTFFPTYIIQAGVGYGIGNSGFLFNLFTRYGFNQESKAQSFNIGIQFDINMIAFRKNLNNPNSAL
ncbi:MAG: hypothetical protein IPN10_18765 [Saprospiraceae bacterium]|nr:hypothetical protein [Saprospiraceae bacterium]